MQNFIEAIQHTPTLVAAAIATLCILFGLLQTLRVYRIKNEFEKKLQLIEKQLRCVSSGSMGVGERLVELESKVQRINFEAHRKHEGETHLSYTQALKLIEQGVDTQSVAANTGLSSSEVNLMELLYAQKQGSSAIPS